MNLTWAAVASAQSYDIKVFNTDTPADVTSSPSSFPAGTTGTTVTLPDGNYRFDVRACVPGPICTAYGSVSFTVFDGVVPLTVIAPTPGQVFGAPPPPPVTLQWSPVSVAQRYEVRVVNTFTLATFYLATFTDGTIQQSSVNPPNGGYRLDVRACKDPVCTAYASVSFAVLQPPVITAPTPGQAIGALPVSLGWSLVDGALGYDVRVVNTGTGRVLVGASLPAESTTPRITIQPPNGSFTFEVRACVLGPICTTYSIVSFTVSGERQLAPPGDLAPVLRGQHPGDALRGRLRRRREDRHHHLHPAEPAGHRRRLRVALRRDQVRRPARSGTTSSPSTPASRW